MGLQKNPYPLRIEDILMEKIKYIAQENGRSVNKEIENVIKKQIAAFEREFGQIPLGSQGKT